MNKVERMMQENREEYGIDLPENEARELAELQLKDLERKGCNYETGDCLGCVCSHMNGGHCPLEDWEKRHPEFANDEIAKRLKELKNKARNEWKTKRKNEVIKDFKNKSFNVIAEARQIFIDVLNYSAFIQQLEMSANSGADAEDQLKLMATIKTVFDKIRSNPLSQFIEKTAIFG